MFPNRVPTDRDTPSPEPLTKRGDSTHSFIHSFIRVSAEYPKMNPPTYLQEEYKVIVHGAPRRRTDYIQWGAAWFPKGIVNDTAISNPIPCSLRYNTFHLGFYIPEPLQPACVVATPIRV